MSEVLDVAGGVRQLEQRLQVLRTGTLPVEDALAVALAELDSCEEELRAVVEQLDEATPAVSGLDVVPVAIVVTDGTGTCRAANVVAARLLGLPRNVLVGKPLAAYVALESRAVFRALLRRARTLPTAPEGSVRLQPRHRPPVDVRVEIGLADGSADRIYWALLPVEDVQSPQAASAEVAHLRIQAPRAAACLSEIASLAGSSADAAALPERIVATVAELVSGIEVAIRPAGGSATASGPVAQAAERAQDEAGEGPALDAARSARPVVATTREVPEAWPRWASLLDGFGVSAVVALPLTSGGVSLGSLALYGTSSGADPSAVPGWILESLATAVAGVLAALSERRAQAELAEQLSAALESRAVIDQAKGIIMSQRRCTADEAFAVLVGASSRRNIKLRIIAQQLVDSVGGSLTRR